MTAAHSETRVAYYDGIRAIAIGAVVLVHWVEPYAPLFLGGYVGVDVFFVLSGFIITTILWRRTASSNVGRNYRAFMVGRVRRL